LKPAHQSGCGADCSVTALSGGGDESTAGGSAAAGAAVARADQWAGVCGVGGTKFGPTAQPAISTDSAATHRRHGTTTPWRLRDLAIIAYDD
jgi:hypothetical protein